MKNEYLLVLTTTATEEDAARLAHELIDAHLAACVHIDALRSIYRWQGKVHEEPEWRMAIKTRADRYAEVENYIRSHHTYETPEIICIEIHGGSEDYLRWISESLGQTYT